MHNHLDDDISLRPELFSDTLWFQGVFFSYLSGKSYGHLEKVCYIIDSCGLLLGADSAHYDFGK